MAEFSLDLNEDQLQIQKWVHDFAENVIRPAAHEWDEREETPWPIIEEAARIGLYSFDFISQAYFDESGCSCPSPTRRWPGVTPGSRSSIFGSTLGLAGIAANGTPEQLIEWGPQCFGTPEKIQTAALRGVRGRRRFRRLVVAHPRGLRRGEGRVGHQRDEDLDHQRRHGRPARGRRLGRPHPRLAGPGELHRPPGTPGLSAGPEVQEDGHPRLAHRRSDPRRRARSRATACSVERTSSTNASRGPARGSARPARRP